METMVEVGTVLPRVVRVSVDCSIEHSAGDSVGMVHCVGYSHHVLATQYPLVPGILNHRHHQCFNVGSR